MTDFAVRAAPGPLMVACPGCGSRFPVDPERIPPQGILAICSACERTFPVLRPAEASPAVMPFASREADAVAAETPADRVHLGTLPPPPTPGPAEVTPTDPVWAAPPGGSGSGAPAVARGTGAPPDGGAGGVGTAATPMPEVPTTPGASSAPEPEPAPVDPPPGSVAGLSGVAAGAIRFGARDPADRARRLARVLASDMITYNPARYAEARAAGTLRQDFEDEIEKSWEEYVDQVGPEMAKGTAYFVDALNEVLGRGEPLFEGLGYPYNR